jgi:hypothetical protein
MNGVMVQPMMPAMNANISNIIQRSMLCRSPWAKRQRLPFLQRRYLKADTSL